ncbi:MAG: PAS domain S-box protein [Candidatus Hodarchaeota archaeon]
MFKFDLLDAKTNKNKEKFWLFSSIVTQSPYIIVITDFEGKIIYVNPEFTQQTGYRFEEVKGKNVNIMKSGKTPTITYKELWDTITKGREWQGEFYNKKKNGEYYWESAFISPIESPEGVITHFFKIAHDVTERKQTENNLYESEKRYHALFNHTNDAVFIVSLDLIHLEANQRAAEMLGYSVDELKGMSVSQIVGKGEYEDSLCVKEALLAGGKVPLYERILRRKDGTEFPVEINVTLVYDDNGAPLLIQSVIRNITERKQAEEKLKESEELFIQFMDHLPAAAFIKDNEGITLYANKYLKEIFGGENWIGKTTAELFPEEVARKMIADDQKALTDGLMTIIEELIDKDNVSNTYQTYKFPIKRKNKSTLLGGIAMNITEQKKAEEQFRYQANLLEEISDAIISSDINFCIISWNKAAETMYGWREDEVLGRPVEEVTQLEYPYDRMEDVLDQFFKEGVWRGEVIQRRKDGQKINILASVSLIKNSVGEPIGALAVNRDITKRKQAEILLQEREERYRALFERTNDAVFILSLELVHLEVNQQAADLLGYTIDELVGMPISQVVAAKEYSDSLRVVAALLAGKHIPVYERIFKRKDGTEIPVEINVAMVFGTDGAPLHIQSVVRNITERKRVEKELRESAIAINELNESLKIINKILRHDILNDLMVIQGNLDIYKLSNDENDLDQAYSAANKSVDLINRMRELEHLISRGKELQTFNIRHIIDEILKNYENGDIKIDVKGTGSALADYALASVIDNLIRNALLHADTDRVDIIIDEQEEFCEVQIADYGIGIPEEVKPRIFEAGFKYGKTGNTGLGLYIVDKVIDRYGGTVRVEDNKPKGTVFILKLKRSNSSL